LAGGEVGEPVVPQRGSGLGELPWAFRSGDDGAFIGEGSVSNRAPEIVAPVPDGCTLVRLNSKVESSPVPGTAPAGEPEDRVHALSRTLRRISEPTAADTGSGRCVIRPSSVHAAEEEHRLSGQRFHDLESAFPLFRDAPILRVAHFRRSLGKSDVKHELALIDVRSMIDLMLAASSSSEASVDLRIVDRSQREHGTARVNRFAAALEHDPDLAFFLVSPLPQEEASTPLAKQIGGSFHLSSMGRCR